MFEDIFEYWLDRVPSNLKDSVIGIRNKVESIWAGPSIIIKNYTSHDLKHSLRLLEYLKIIIEECKINLDQEENYLLVISTLLHDIGMQCNHKEVFEKTKLNIKYKNNHEYNFEEQTMIRENHHLLTKNWIIFAWKSYNKTDLELEIKKINRKYIQDIIDICCYHSSRLDIRDCKEKLHIGKNTKQFLATLLRFADELDISEKRVNGDFTKDFKIQPENAIFWWLHSLTEVSFEKTNITINVDLHEKDFEKYGDLINEIYINAFRSKNGVLLDILAKNNAALHISFESGCRQYEFANELPIEVGEFLNELKKKRI